MKRLVLLFLSMLVISFRSSAQEAPKVKFEKVSQEEMAMKTYLNDTTAEAVILYDEGSSYVKYEVGDGFKLTFERFVRIKILKQSGVSWGNFMVSLYSNGSSKEDLQQIKGTTSNYEKGKIVQSELKKDAIFRERENKFWEAVRISLPSVKVGSVIDLHYTISTNLMWNLRTWKFQYAIPVRWSQYKVVYPEYFNYNHTMLGYHRLLINKSSQSTESINYFENVRTNQGGFSSAQNQAVNQNITYQTKTFDYAAMDIPAIKTEPYLTTIENFTSRIKFELASINFLLVGGKFKNYTTSWIDIAKELALDDNFGLQLKNDNFAKDIVNQLTKGIDDTLGKLNAVFHHVQKVMKWDGSNSCYTSKNLKKTYADKTGNSADINLLLTVMLNKAGISANPVILSTRQNGMISFAHASISDCNYVIVKAVVDGKPFLLDATEPSLQAGYIPFRCLNGEGQLITTDGAEPVPLQNTRSVEITKVDLEIVGGKVSGTLNNQLTGLNAYDFREAVKLAGGKQEFFNKLKNSSSDIDYSTYAYVNLDSLELPIIQEYKISLKEGQEAGSDIVYIDPIVIGRVRSNPFNSPQREYPVEFGVPSYDIFTIQFKIPEGYKVDELPKNLSMTTEDNGAKFVYQVVQAQNKIVVSLRISIDKTTFLPSEYQGLKEFYNAIVNKEAEQIILKKI